MRRREGRFAAFQIIVSLKKVGRRRKTPDIDFMAQAIGKLRDQSGGKADAAVIDYREF